MKRRDFVVGGGGGVLAASVTGRGVAQTTRRPQDRPLILDANGEIRLTHPMSLIPEMKQTMQVNCKAVAMKTRSISLLVQRWNWLHRVCFMLMEQMPNQGMGQLGARRFRRSKKASTAPIVH